VQEFNGTFFLLTMTNPNDSFVFPPLCLDWNPTALGLLSEQASDISNQALSFSSPVSLGDLGDFDFSFLEPPPPIPHYETSNQRIPPSPQLSESHAQLFSLDNCANVDQKEAPEVIQPPQSTVSGSLSLHSTTSSRVPPEDPNSSWASHNPQKPVQPSRQRTSKKKSDAEKLSAAQHAKAQAASKEVLATGIQAIIKAREDAISALAKQHSVTEKSIRVRVNAETLYVKPHKVSMYNALISKKSKELNASKCFDFKLEMLRPRTFRMNNS